VVVGAPHGSGGEEGDLEVDVDGAGAARGAVLGPRPGAVGGGVCHQQVGGGEHLRGGRRTREGFFSKPGVGATPHPTQGGGYWGKVQRGIPSP